MITREEYQVTSEARAFLVLFLLVLLSITYAAIYFPFIPTKNGFLGGNYSFIMPNLFAGHYWYIKNGWFDIPWFSPSFCAMSLFLIVSAVLWFGFHIPNFFYEKSYKGSCIENAWSAAVSPSSVLPINHVGAFTTPEGKIQMPVNRNDGLIIGGSEFSCYQAIMGYRLEKFPIGSLVLGPAMQSAEGRFNFKNTAYCLFPFEKNCFPDDHFQTSQSSELINFLSYEKFNCSKPSWFEWLSTFSLVAWIFVGLTFTLTIGKYLYSKQSRFSRTK